MRLRARALSTAGSNEHPPRNDDAWHPFPLSKRVGNWIVALTLVPELASRKLSGSLWRQLRRLEANVEDDVLGHHVIRSDSSGGHLVGELRRRGSDADLRETEACREAATGAATVVNLACDMGSMAFRRR